MDHIRELSLIIPAYNEQDRILATLLDAYMFCSRNFSRWEIIIVDDGSDVPIESTLKKLSDIPVRIFRCDKNRGKGYAVSLGVLNARYPWILFSDADLSTPLVDFFRLEQHHEKYDIIIGSRRLSDSDVIKSQGFIRVTLGNMLPFVVNIILGLRYKDTQCGFKLMRRSAVVPLFEKLTVERFMFDAELLYLAKKYNLWVNETGVHWKNDVRSKLVLFRDAPEMFWSLIKIRFFNKYD